AKLGPPPRIATIKGDRKVFVHFSPVDGKADGVAREGVGGKSSPRRRRFMDLDLNCDLGEGCPHDAELMPLITTANIACGFHAGGPAEARAALVLARQHGARAGAHPGFPDRDQFGRRELDRGEEQVFEDCVYQIGALDGLARAAGVSLSHVKAHGALYNLAMREDRYARPVIAAAELFGLPLMGLPGS